MCEAANFGEAVRWATRGADSDAPVGDVDAVRACVAA
jgi:hypothetical protein